MMDKAITAKEDALMRFIGYVMFICFYKEFSCFNIDIQVLTHISIISPLVVLKFVKNEK